MAEEEEKIFNNIVISTETIIAKTNWKVDIVELFNHLTNSHHKIPRRFNLLRAIEADTAEYHQSKPPPCRQLLRAFLQLLVD